MKTYSPTTSSIWELLQERVEERSRRWNLVAVPILALGLFSTLELFNLFLPEHLTHASIIVVSLFVTTVTVAGQMMLRHLRNRRIYQDPLLQQLPSALTDVGLAATTKQSRREIIEVLCDHCQELLHPTTLQTVLYDLNKHSYRVTPANEVLLARTPFIQKLINLPPATLIPLPVEDCEQDDEALLQQMMDRGTVLIVTFGKQGWLELGPPEDGEQYTDVQKSLLWNLTRPATLGLSRAAVIEGQQKRARELNALYWLAQAINFTMPLDDIMEMIYTQLSRVIPLPIFFIALRNTQGDKLKLAFYVEGDERSYEEVEWGADEGLTGQILRTGISLRTDDYFIECSKRGIEPKFRSERVNRAWMGAPLIAGDKSIGVMVATSYEADMVFTKEDESFFMTVAAYTASILERHTLYARLETRARQLRSLNEIGNLLASSLDINELLSLVVNHAATLLESEAGSLLLLDEESGDLVFRISSGPAGKKLVGMRIPAGKGIAGVTFAENHPVIVNDTRNDPRWYASFDQEAEFVTRSILAVPLNARGRTIGVLEVLNHLNGLPYTDEEVDLLLSFGAQAAISIENTRLFMMTDQALQARLEELTMLQRIDRQLNTTLDYRAVMEHTLEWAMRITGAEVGLVAALQEDDEATGLRFLAVKGYPEDVMRPFVEEGKLWPLSQGIIGRATRKGEICLLKDALSDPDYYAAAPGMTAQLSVPIRREQRVIGIIALEASTGERFNEDNVEFIGRLVDHAAIAIENARLFQEVQRANEAKTEFVSFVSHELKQPMTSIKGYTDLLMKEIGGPLNAQQKQFLQVVRSNVERMDRLVRDLLDVSRIESGRLRLEMGVVVPEEIVSEAVQAYQQAIAAKKQQLNVEIEPGLPTVIGDRGRLIQVMTNLVSNANKYTPTGGTITLRVGLWYDNGKKYVRWSVQDTGIGMTEEEQKKLFTKYFRAANKAVRSEKGTGLGLVITRSIIEMHGGQIWVESEYQKGSTFSFTVPVRPQTGILEMHGGIKD